MVADMAFSFSANEGKSNVLRFAPPVFCPKVLFLIVAMCNLGLETRNIDS